MNEIDTWKMRKDIWMGRTKIGKLSGTHQLPENKYKSE